MATLPTESDLTGATRTNAQMRATHAQLRAYLAGMLGVDGTVPAALAALGVLASAGHVTRTSATTLTAADRGRVISATSGSWTLTLPGAAAAGAGWAVILRNAGTGTVSVARAGSDLIDGVSSVALLPGTAALVLSTGSAWVSTALGGVIGGPLRAPDGTAGAPGIAFGADPDTGLYRPAADQIALVTGGVQRALLSSTALQLDVLVTGTAVAQSPTDTTAGRLLRVGSHGLGSLNPRNDGAILADWLSTTEATGFHHMGNDAETQNKPIGVSGAGWGSAITVRTSNVAGARFGWRGFREATEFFMQKWDSGGWGKLCKFFHTRNVVGTVVNASGVPDGALMQGNASAAAPTGGWTERLADGFQTVHHSLTSSASANTTWTYNSAFLAGSTPVITAQPIGDADYRVRIVSRTETACVFSIRDTAGNRVAVPVDLTARGRWSDMT